MVRKFAQGAASAVFLFLAAACGSSGGATAPPLFQRLGPDGGQFQTGSNGDILLDVPAGALTASTLLTMQVDQPTPVDGYLDVGPCIRFGPTVTEFTAPATLYLPYSSLRLSDAVDPATELRVARRDANGQVRILSPLLSTAVNVILEVGGLGSFWVIAPDVVSAAALLPLHAGDTYAFAAGLELAVARPTSAPNLPPGTIVLTLAMGGREWGSYLATPDHTLCWLGSFEGSAVQEVMDAPLLLLDRREAVGSVRPGTGTYRGFEPVGAATAAYQGLQSAVTEVLGHERIATVVGVFETTRVRWSSARSDTRGGTGAAVQDLWLAEGVGPVAVQLPGMTSRTLLVGGTVGGRPILGN